MFEKFKSLFGAQDMTVGNPTTVLLKFAIPLIIGNFAQQLYNTVDSIVVGKYIGDSALAAVGASMPVINLLFALFMGVAAGAGIIVSQYYGAKQREGLSLAIGNILTLTLVVGSIVSILGLILTRPLLNLLNTPEEIIDGATQYLLIFMGGFLGGAFYNMGSGILRGLGDSIMPLVYLLFCCGLNIVLDITFVAVVQMGVGGVALATVLAQLISVIFVIIRLRNMKSVFDMKPKYFKPNFNLIKKVFLIGLPGGATQAIFSLSAMVVQSLTNSFGAAIIAVNTIIMRVDGFAMMPNFSFGMAMTTYIGQNVGANKQDRVQSAAKHGLKIGLIFDAIMVGFLFIACKPLMSMFTDTPEVIQTGSSMLRLLAAGYLCVCAQQILLGIMRGAGDTVTPMIISIIATVAIRVPVAYLIDYLTGHNYICLFASLLISWVLGTALTVFFYKVGKWKKMAKKSQVSEIVD